MLVATYNINGRIFPKSWRVGTPLQTPFPEQICEVEAYGPELDYILQFIPHERITLRTVKFYGFDAFNIVRGVNEDYYKENKVIRYEEIQ